ncbi:DUF2956 domain-containing protein [Algibacillus agarilyticus]|uniref:DUF2956 domain-containing protein n=1 Tax=Algibacillus agarilyticus TaxID=2234133 RepID=UPI000DD00DD8|nr:DUF2956 domain-containing protein [Algibacillus agarilyticus]
MNHKKDKQDISPEVQAQAMAMAKATQKPGQSKEQTKLIAQGIEKGIAEYKKQQKVKARELDKKLKQVRRNETNKTNGSQSQEPSTAHLTLQEPACPTLNWLPWCLLVLSWLFFIGFYVVYH